MPTPYDAPIPGAAGYETAALQAKTAYQNALARINSKRSDTLRQYGYLGDIDPTTGVVGNVRVDPNNQYGGLQQMLRANADTVQQVRDAADERGLHGGLAHKGITDARYDLGNASQQLGSAFTGALGGFQDDQNQAAYSRDQALYEAEAQAARDAIAAQAFNQADFGDTNYDEPYDNGNPSGGDYANPPEGDGTQGDGVPSKGPASALSPAGAYTQGAAQLVNRLKKQGKPIPYVHSPGLNTTTPTPAKKVAPKSSIPYVNSPGANPVSAKKTTTAAAKIVAAAKKKKGGK